VLSPCVTFNDHEGSTRSYAYTREHYEEVVHADFVPHAPEIAVSYAEGELQPVTMHDGSQILLRKLDQAYDPTDRGVALETIQERIKHNEYLTGLLYIAKGQPEFHAQNATPDGPLNELSYERLRPAPAALEKIMARYR